VTSVFKATFVSEDITPDKKEADIINQGASNIRNSQKRQCANTFFATNRQKVKRAHYKACVTAVTL
jgi:hypothetical protein